MLSSPLTALLMQRVSVPDGKQLTGFKSVSLPFEPSPDAFLTCVIATIACGMSLTVSDVRACRYRDAMQISIEIAKRLGWELCDDATKTARECAQGQAASKHQARKTVLLKIQELYGNRLPKSTFDRIHACPGGKVRAFTTFMALIIACLR